jgi:hypothetical protein
MNVSFRMSDVDAALDLADCGAAPHSVDARGQRRR